MRIYDTQRSGNAWKVRLLASLLGQPLARTTLSIDRGDAREARFLAVSPLRQVPVLELDDGRTLSESMAILFYLAQGTPWWPTDPFEQAQVLTWLAFEQEKHMHPLAQLRLHLALHGDRDPGDADMQAHALHAHHALTLLEQQLGRAGATGWVASSPLPSIADVALYPYTRLAPMGGIRLSAYPHIERWLSRFEALPGYEGLVPGRPDLNFTLIEYQETTS